MHHETHNKINLINVNHNSSIALERSVINNWGGGLNRFYRIQTSPTASAVVHNI